MSESTKPVAQIRKGMINAAIWRNTNGSGVFFNVTFERRYRDDSGTWQSTKSFSRDDLLVIAHVATHAFDSICEMQDQERKAQRDADGQDGPADEDEPAPPPSEPPASVKKATAAAAASVVKRSAR